jgi:hypothetical protein
MGGFRASGLSLFVLGALAAPALAGDFNPLGDGSTFDNADLLRDKTTGCENCAPVPPHEWDAPPFDLDWSLGLRGALIQDSSGLRYEGLALPSVTLTHRALRGGYSFGIDGEVSVPVGGEARIDSLGFSDYALDSVTRAGGTARLMLTQDDPDGPGWPANVLTTPLVISGTATGTVERDIGVVTASLRGSVGRSVNGETVYDDLSTTDNSWRNTTTAMGGGRLGLRLTPGVSAFADAEGEWELYDGPSPSLLVPLDNLTVRGRVGLSGGWGEVLSAEASVGVAWRDFADPSLGDLIAGLYDARLTFRPDETVELSAAFTTQLASPGGNSGASTRLQYAATGNTSYRVNPWLKLRASAGWSETHLIGPGDVQTQVTGGAGLDYLLNANTDLTADYLYTRTDIPPDPAEEEHKVTLGITFHR